MPFHDPIERLATSFIPSSTQRRRVLLAVDVLLGLAICWAALAPLPDSDLGATSGYVEPNLDHRVAQGVRKRSLGVRAAAMECKFDVSRHLSSRSQTAAQEAKKSGSKRRATTRWGGGASNGRCRF